MPRLPSSLDFFFRSLPMACESEWRFMPVPPGKAFALPASGSGCASSKRFSSNLLLGSRGDTAWSDCSQCHGPLVWQDMGCGHEDKNLYHLHRLHPHLLQDWVMQPNVAQPKPCTQWKGETAVFGDADIIHIGAICGGILHMPMGSLGEGPVEWMDLSRVNEKAQSMHIHHARQI